MNTIAVISDIHGNGVALDAVLADLEERPADGIVCLGDAIQGGPEPVEVVERLRALGCPVVMGNADDWLLSGETTNPQERVTPQQEAVRAWQLARLSDEQKAFIASFQPTVELEIGDVRFLCFHGSPASFHEIILPETTEEEFKLMLGAWEGWILAGGHTHLQQVRRLGNGFFFNPGSVGLPYNRYQPQEGFQIDPWAEYAVLSSQSGRLSLEFRRVPVDIEALIAALRDTGRPHGEERIAGYKGRARS